MNVMNKMVDACYWNIEALELRHYFLSTTINSFFSI